jgi:hypothetical protein
MCNHTLTEAATKSMQLWVAKSERRKKVDTFAAVCETCRCVHSIAYVGESLEAIYRRVEGLEGCANTLILFTLVDACVVLTSFATRSTDSAT